MRGVDSGDAGMKELRIKSGEVSHNGRIASFLYDLMRDHMPPGKVESLVRAADGGETSYTNGWLAEYAIDLETRLLKK